jgi:hypothetical protein
VGWVVGWKSPTNFETAYGFISQNSVQTNFRNADEPGVDRIIQDCWLATVSRTYLFRARNTKTRY